LAAYISLCSLCVYLLNLYEQTPLPFSRKLLNILNSIKLFTHKIHYLEKYITTLQKKRKKDVSEILINTPKKQNS